jgi:hypothetical protein
VLDQIALFAALRRGDLDLTARAQRQGLGEQPRILDLVRQQHEAGARLVGIELRQKRIKHFGQRQAAVGARIIGGVAPVLIGAEEKGLDAELPGLLDHGEDIRLLDMARVDPLRALNGRQRGDAVAQARRRLELQRLGGVGHFGGEPLTHRPAFAGEKVARFLNERGVVGGRNFAGARAGAPLDLEFQAGPGAVGEIGVRARAQQKGALQRVERAIDGAGVGEGAEIVALAAARAAMLGQHRRGMVAGEQDIGEALVVAHQHVEARLHLLDEIGLEQQRLGLGFRRDEDH